MDIVSILIPWQSIPDKLTFKEGWSFWFTVSVHGRLILLLLWQHVRRQHIVSCSEWWCHVASYSRFGVIAIVVNQSNYDQFGTFIALKLPARLSDADFCCCWFELLYDKRSFYFSGGFNRADLAAIMTFTLPYGQPCCCSIWATTELQAWGRIVVR